jgi:hypothetical protein
MIIARARACSWHKLLATTQAESNMYFSQKMNFKARRMLHPVLKIEVFNALQTRFGPSKYTSLKNNPSKRNPKLKMKTTSLEVLNIIYPPQALTSVHHCHYKKWS